MFIKHNVRNEFDVFTGKGWGNWTRVRRGNVGAYGVAGQRLAHPVMREVSHLLEARIPTMGLTVKTA